MKDPKSSEIIIVILSVIIAYLIYNHHQEKKKECSCIETFDWRKGLAAGVGAGLIGGAAYGLNRMRINALKAQEEEEAQAKREADHLADVERYEQAMMEARLNPPPVSAAFQRDIDEASAAGLKIHPNFLKGNEIIRTQNEARRVLGWDGSRPPRREIISFEAEQRPIAPAWQGARAPRREVISFEAEQRPIEPEWQKRKNYMKQEREKALRQSRMLLNAFK